MASGYISSGTNFSTQRDAHISLGTNEYPSGTVSVSGTWRNRQELSCYYDVYLCDSSGSNSQLIDRFQINGASQYGPNDEQHTVSKSITATGLKGKALYVKIVGVGSGPDSSKIEAYGNLSVSVATKVDSYTITINSATGGSCTASATSAAPGTVITLTPRANSGYSHTGYTTSPSVTISNNKFTMPSSNISITPTFSANSYTVTVNGTANTWTFGTQHTISAPAQTGKTFSSWSLSGAGSIASASSSSTTFTVGAGNATLTSNYSWVYYTVSKAVSPSGTGSVSTGKTSAHMGEEVTVSATPSTGYQLSSWSTNVSGVSVNNGKFTMPASNITVTGNFSKVAYAINMRANPTEGGTPSASKSTANYGDSITLSNNRSSGYLFDGWTSSDVAISGNSFTMPAKAVTITGNYHIGRSTATISKTSMTPGDVVRLTITPESSSFYHKYKLSFGLGMESELVTLSAGTTTADIYIPLAWSRMLKSIQKTGGTLTVYTYESDNSLLGEYVIDSLVYNALNNTIPKLQIRRVDDEGTTVVKGTKAKYTITLPAGIDGYTLSCDEVEAENPPKTGLLMPDDVMTFPTTDSVPVELEVVFGEETFTLTESVPSVWLLSKSVG